MSKKTSRTVFTRTYDWDRRFNSVDKDDDESLIKEEAPESVTKNGIVSGKLVNVRDAPEQNARVLTVVEKGTKVDILDECGSWYHVHIKESRITGYMIGECVSEV